MPAQHVLPGVWLGAQGMQTPAHSYHFSFAGVEV